MSLNSRTLQSTPEYGAPIGWTQAPLGSKLHATGDTLGQVRALHVTPANAYDRAAVAMMADAVKEATGGSVNWPKSIGGAIFGRYTEIRKRSPISNREAMQLLVSIPVV